MPRGSGPGRRKALARHMPLTAAAGTGIASHPREGTNTVPAQLTPATLASSAEAGVASRSLKN
jgi:hypothetical protein